MSDVVLGAAIGVVAAVVGALVSGAITWRLQVGAEDRGRRRRRDAALTSAKLRALDQAHHQMVVSAEYARAVAVGEATEQVRRLREQSESVNFLEADVSLLRDPDLASQYLERTRWWLDQARPLDVTEAQLAVDAELANRVQSAFRLARERILSEANEVDGAMT